MASKKSETKFVPCVARHFTHRTVSFGITVDKKLGDLERQVAEYQGMDIPEIAEALGAVREAAGPLQDAVLTLARLLNTRSSQPIDL